MNDSHLFKTAKECSFNSNYTVGGRARIGCVIVYKGAILAKGWNSDKTHTAQAQFNVWRYKDSGNNYLPPKCHAECMALQKIKYLDIDFSRVHIYIYRELRDGKLAMARPCSACFAAIKSYGIKHIHYTTNEGFAYEKIIQSLTALFFCIKCYLFNVV